ncbi:MAG: hypothetical protein PHE72_14790 [candidate division Zixibacteria bacterium]|nr:hypothetical protein [candidate division Zixibacteria bacterium]
MSLKADLLTDLPGFLATAEFADEVTLTGGAKINGIFDDEHRLINEQDGQISSTAPQVICRSTDVSGVALGATVTIKGVAYKVIERQPDGTGLTTLILSRD